MIKSFFNEFKKFAMRGNMIDMAVGIIIGAAFGKVVDSLVKDVIMPPLGVLLGKVDFSNLFLVLKKGAEFEGALCVGGSSSRSWCGYFEFGEFYKCFGELYNRGVCRVFVD